MDYLLIGCDGIFDKLTNNDVANCVWDETFTKGGFSNVHEFAARAVENVIMMAFKKKSLDNVTVVMVIFKNLKKVIERECKKFVKEKHFSTE